MKFALSLIILDTFPVGPWEQFDVWPKTVNESVSAKLTLNKKELKACRYEFGVKLCVAEICRGKKRLLQMSLLLLLSLIHTIIRASYTGHGRLVHVLWVRFYLTPSINNMSNTIKESCYKFTYSVNSCLFCSSKNSWDLGNFRMKTHCWSKT